MVDILKTDCFWNFFISLGFNISCLRFGGFKLATILIHNTLLGNQY